MTKAQEPKTVKLVYAGHGTDTVNVTVAEEDVDRLLGNGLFTRASATARKS